MPKRLGPCERLYRNAMENFTEEKPKDYVIATGQAYSVREFINIASNFLNMKIY